MIMDTPSETRLKPRYKQWYALSVLALGCVLIAFFVYAYALIVSPPDDPNSALNLAILVAVIGFVALVSQAFLVFTRFISMLGSDEATIRELRAELDQLMVLDPLTRVYNRYKFESVIGRELENVRRYGNPLSGVMFDIDDFKSINEAHGYPAGDRLLADMAAFVKSKLRNTDYMFRWHGGKFIILAPHTDIDHAAQLAEKLRELAGHKLFGGKIRLTLALGVIQAVDSDTMETFLRRIQSSLTGAKHLGPDRVSVLRYEDFPATG